MGVKYAEGVILDMEAMCSEAEKRVPLVCFLSMGSDPTENIERLAKSKVWIIIINYYMLFYNTWLLLVSWGSLNLSQIFVYLTVAPDKQFLQTVTTFVSPHIETII